MPIDLDHALEWTTATGDAQTMLENLQANIIKGHVRDHLTLLFLRFDVAAEGSAFLHAVAPLVKSAHTHLLEVEAFKSGTPLASATSYVGVGLSGAGYAVLGGTAPVDTSFAQPGGMRGSRAKLADPPVSTWEDGYRGDVHAVVLIGDSFDRQGRQVQTVQAVLALITDGISVVAQETGLSQVNGDGHGIEHFGYVDGRSQPLFLTEDVADETNGSDGATVWNPEFPLKQLLVADPAASDPTTHFGSYFVFRKLEQNVALFKAEEQALADRLGLEDEDRERAGAMLIGRYEDGTPVTLQSQAGGHSPVMNDFDYASDAHGSKCPFHGHIRKTNPRGSGGGPGGTPTNVEFERSHIMARRGQTFGRRTDDPNGDVAPADRPSDGVGLLFMAFNADLGNQFEFTQGLWADNEDFPFSAPGAPALKPGLDPIIGQGPRPEADFPLVWGSPQLAADGKDANMVPTDTAAQAVTMKGGQYFFMPSLESLGTL